MILAMLLAVAQLPQVELPDAGWVAIFFGTDADQQSIWGRTKASNLKNLQRTPLPKGAVEVRIWEGFGLTYLEGYRFRYENNRWRGWWIQPLQPSKKSWKALNYLQELKEPKTGWPSFWQTLESANFYGLPDFESLPGKKATVNDGVCYVVEIAKDGRYRTYMYDNPNLQPDRWQELRQLRLIVKTVHGAFREQVSR